MTSMKFKGHEHAQAQINEYANGKKTLQSYNTELIEIVNDWLTVLCLYDSNTSRRHIGWFGRLYGLSYQEVKNLALNGYSMNVKTGEIIETNRLKAIV